MQLKTRVRLCESRLLWLSWQGASSRNLAFDFFLSYHANRNFSETCPNERAERGERAQEHPPPLRDGPLWAVPGQVSHQLPLRATRERVHQPSGQALLRQGASDYDVAGAVQAHSRWERLKTIGFWRNYWIRITPVLSYFLQTAL